ncbi:MAG TPA: hypothetical protein VIC04_00605 [Terriglobia bacterium]
MSTAMYAPGDHENKRSSPRLTLTIPVVILGKDSNGKSIIEKTHTVVVNQRGAKVVTSHSFALGASVDVAVPHLKRLSGARVVWLGSHDSDVPAIGLDLGQCSDFWGVELMDTAPNAYAEGGQNQNAVSAAHANALGTERKNGNGSAQLPVGLSALIPVLQTDRSDKLSSAIEELVQTAIERCLGELLPRVNAEAEQELRKLSTSAIEQAQTRVDRMVEEAIGKLETQVAAVLGGQRTIWEQTLQEVARKSQERLETSLSEYQSSLAAKAENVRHELARKLADLGSTLDKA